VSFYAATILIKGQPQALLVVLVLSVVELATLAL
jgi:hypothetical protein